MHKKQLYCSIVRLYRELRNPVADLEDYDVVMDVFKMFTAHPESLGESYVEHLGAASSFGGRMILAGIACILHGLMPFLFSHTGSRAISELNARMLARRNGVPAPAALRIDLLNS